MKKGPIIIVGFGRSGTTWLSDIISKTLGGIILFEPFHPKVFLESQSYCYTSSFSSLEKLESHINECYKYSSKSAWLLRNHISRSEDANSSFIKYISNNTEVIGFKSIRSNHCSPLLLKIFGSKAILIHRHPLAVLASIINRPQFWNEYGWNWHSEEFFNRVVIEKNFSLKQISIIRKIQSSLKSKNEIIVLMWALSFIISLNDIKGIGGHVIIYEDLYLNPFNQIRQLLNYLDKSSSKIHPSHIFTPSLTTLNTIHSFSIFEDLSREKLDDLFWKKHFNKDVLLSLQQLLYEVLSLDQEALNRAISCGYIDR